MTNNRIKNDNLAHDMIAHLEKDVSLQEDDVFYLTLDKREHRYMIFYNCRNSHQDHNDLIIYEGCAMPQFRTIYDFEQNKLHPFSRYKFKVAESASENPPGNRFMRMR